MAIMTDEFEAADEAVRELLVRSPPLRHRVGNLPSADISRLIVAVLESAEKVRAARPTPAAEGG